ncbi:magnesium transporter [Salinibacterium sp. PAMC 21357]|uniref:magnesium transporter n=1 Tax=Salinibacterium sp. PAMC 21357 TaxID=1112215 RepID=UPI0002899FC8|nr:magnesium transporter [Salinibacterium sp. PAMC 21357]
MPEPIDPADFVRLIRARSLSELASQARAAPRAEVVAVLEALPADDAAVVFRLLSKDESIEVFDALDPGAQAELIAELGDAQIAGVFAALDPEEQAWLLDELPAKVAKRLMASLDKAEYSAAMLLLGYPNDSVGRRMSPVPLTTAPTASVADVLSSLRNSSADFELLSAIAVIGPNRTLLGVVDPLVLLRHDESETIGTVMAPPVSARTEDDAEQVARRSLDGGILVLPVVDREDRLVGVFPISDAARIDREAVAEDQARAGAAEPLRRAYLVTPIRKVVNSRIVWLLVLAVSAVLTVSVLELFETTLNQRVALALFVPLLIGIGGNTGSQAATTVTRALALGDVTPRDVGRVAFKEVRTGLLLGFFLALLGFAIASWAYGTDIGLVIGLTLLVNCPIAATVGGVIPLVARAIHVDPAVFSTPFIATFCDATGLLVYFSIAIGVLGLSA